jgi:Spy/CpxP family protein refolding chaperone
MASQLGTLLALSRVGGVMKANSIVILAMLMAMMPITLSAQVKPGDGSANAPIVIPDSAQDDTALKDAQSASDVVPRDPKEFLQEYEAEMQAITQRFAAALVSVTEAVGRGELTSEQGQKITTELYQVAQMRFELLGAWRIMVEHDLAQVPTAAAPPAPAINENREIVMVALPFSSFELNPSLAEYLNLSQSQIEAIQQVMARERGNVQPLIAQLKAAKEKLLAADARQPNDKNIKVLADTQAGLLAKLIVANAQMQSKIYKLLTPEQQGKLDNLKRSNESAAIVASAK